MVPSIYSEIPSYLRESHVLSLGYLLSRGIADIETIGGTRNCVKANVRAPSQQRIRQVRRRTQLKVRLVARSRRSSTALVDDGFALLFFPPLAIADSTLRSRRVARRELFSYFRISLPSLFHLLCPYVPLSYLLALTRILSTSVHFSRHTGHSGSTQITFRIHWL